MNDQTFESINEDDDSLKVQSFISNCEKQDSFELPYFINEMMN